MMCKIHILFVISLNVNGAAQQVSKTNWSVRKLGVANPGK